MNSRPIGTAASQCILGPLSAQECAGNQHPQRIQCVPGPVIVQGWHHFPLFTDEKTKAEVGSSLSLPGAGVQPTPPGDRAPLSGHLVVGKSPGFAASLRRNFHNLLRP